MRDYLTVLLVLGTLLPCAAGGSASSALLPDDMAEKIDRVLEHAASPAPPTRSVLVTQLRRLGDDALPRLVLRIDQDCDPRGLAPAAREVLLAGAAAFQRSAVLPLLRGRHSAQAGACQRSTALSLLGEVGLATDLTLALSIASPPGGPSPALSAEFLETFGAVFDRDERVEGGLGKLVRAAHADIRGALVFELGRRGRRATLEPLAGLLGVFPEQDAALLGAIGRIAGRVGPPFEDRVRSGVRSMLSAGPDPVRREAVLALGRMSEFDACVDLVQLLESDNTALRDAAHWSLNHMTGLGFPLNPRRWETWLQREERWYDSRLERLRSDIEGVHAGTALDAIGELAGRRYKRHQLAAMLGRALGHRSSTVRLHACLALRQVGSAMASADLIATLDDEVEEVAVAALTTLRSITGQDLPPDQDDWREALSIR